MEEYVEPSGSDRKESLKSDVPRDVTKGKHAKDTRLREVEERYRTLVETVPAITYIQVIKDGTSITTYVSPQNERILGYTPEECLADPDHWIKILHPEDRERVLAEDRRTNEGEESFTMEYRQLAKDGRVVWIRDEATLVRDEEGEPLYWLGVQTDVTERKEAEERFRSLVQNSSDVITVVDVAGTILYDSPALEKVLGYKPEERVGTNAFDYIGPDESERVTGMLQEILASPGARLTGEMWWPHRDGSFRYLEVTATNLLEDPAVRGIVINWRDKTEQKEIEKTLKESEERFRSLIQNASDVILIMGSDQTVRYISPAVERVLGYKPEDVVGLDNFTPVHPDDMPRMEKLMGEVMGRLGTTVPPIELRLRHANGSWRYVETTCTNLLGDPAVGGIVFNTRDITERKTVEEQLKHRALHDPLTDLPNRQLLLDRLGQALRRTRRRRYSRVAILLMDLDNFKSINDSFGHEMGDLLLVVVAERLKRCLRPEDTLARFGGDEFVVLLEDATSPDEAVRVKERIAEAFKSPFVLEGRQLYVSASTGIALGEDRTESPEELLRSADTALYEAKSEAGAFGHRVFDPDMHKRVLNRLSLETDLRRAIEQGEFDLYYQPKVRLGEEDTIAEVEALLRWEHPRRGPLLPEEFIWLAEETGLIVPLGRWILKEACHQVKEWQDRYPKTPPLAACVNVSAGQLLYPDLHHNVVMALKECGIEARSLVLEITESALVKNLKTNMTMLKELRKLGVRFAVDDFGSEYSSLSYLMRLPVDFVKIDKSFVWGLGEDPKATVIVEAIISLAHSLGLEAVGEGVESAEQLMHLRSMGCDLAQGFHLSGAMPSEELDRLLADQLNS